MDELREYQIRLWRADHELLYGVPTISMSEKVRSFSLSSAGRCQHKDRQIARMQATKKITDVECGQLQDLTILGPLGYSFLGQGRQPMSLRNFKSVQKMQDVIMIHFTIPNASEWGDTMSVTIPVADAKKLVDMVQAALQPKGASK